MVCNTMFRQELRQVFRQVLTSYYTHIQDVNLHFRQILYCHKNNSKNRQLAEVDTYAIVYQHISAYRLAETLAEVYAE